MKPHIGHIVILSDASQKQLSRLYFSERTKVLLAIVPFCKVNFLQLCIFLLRATATDTQTQQVVSNEFRLVYERQQAHYSLETTTIQFFFSLYIFLRCKTSDSCFLRKSFSTHFPSSLAFFLHELLNVRLKIVYREISFLNYSFAQHCGLMKC